MRRRIRIALAAPGAIAQGDEETRPRVLLETSIGDIVLELEPARAPATVRNFLRYVEDGYYDGLVFHRVIEDFMIQGGGFDVEMNRRTTRVPIRNESKNGLRNARGTVAMARTRDPHSATAQFFINLIDNDFLDHGQSRDGWGYAVFGRVVEGMEIVDRIGAVRTGARAGLRDVPVEPVMVVAASVVSAQAD